GRSFCRFLRDRVGRLLLHSRIVSLRGGSGSWRLLFALCVCLLILACWLLRFLSWLSRRLLRLLIPKRLRTKLPMLPEFSVEAGVPSEVHPASAIAAATTVDVRSARTRDRERSISW